MCWLDWNKHKVVFTTALWLLGHIPIAGCCCLAAGLALVCSHSQMLLCDCISAEKNLVLDNSTNPGCGSFRDLEPPSTWLPRSAGMSPGTPRVMHCAREHLSSHLEDSLNSQNFLLAHSCSVTSCGLIILYPVKRCVTIPCSEFGVGTRRHKSTSTEICTQHLLLRTKEYWPGRVLDLLKADLSNCKNHCLTLQTCSNFIEIYSSAGQNASQVSWL